MAQSTRRWCLISGMTPIKLSWVIYATIAAALFAVPYKFWLTTPVLQTSALVTGDFGNFGRSGVGAAFALMGVATPVMSCGAIVGLLMVGVSQRGRLRMMWQSRRMVRLRAIWNHAGEKS